MEAKRGKKHQWSGTDYKRKFPGRRPVCRLLPLFRTRSKTLLGNNSARPIPKPIPRPIPRSIPNNNHQSIRSHPPNHAIQLRPPTISKKPSTQPGPLKSNTRSSPHFPGPIPQPLPQSPNNTEKAASKRPKGGEKRLMRCTAKRQRPLQSVIWVQETRGTTTALERQMADGDAAAFRESVLTSLGVARRRRWGKWDSVWDWGGGGQCWIEGKKFSLFPKPLKKKILCFYTYETPFSGAPWKTFLFSIWLLYNIPEKNYS